MEILERVEGRQAVPKPGDAELTESGKSPMLSMYWNLSG
jgi:hypothetical protein